MGIPLRQQIKVGAYILKQHLAGRKRYPLVLMLEPLFRCNLACAGCGKIDYPDAILNKRLSVEECLDAVDECGAPVVVDRRRRAAAAQGDAGDRRGHPRAARITSSSAPMRCCSRSRSSSTSRTALHLDIHLDGDKEQHDRAVCQEGVYDRAVAAIKLAKAQGFRVTINATLFNNAEPERMAKFFDSVTEMGVDAIMVSPGYAYERAPDQQHFLNRRKTKELFRGIFGRGKGAGSSAIRRCSSTCSPATRPTTARPGATRRATSSAGSGPATCSAKATPRPSTS